MPSFFMQKNSQGTGDGWSLFPDMREKIKISFPYYTDRTAYSDIRRNSASLNTGAVL